MRYALITGASRGIGRAIAERFAADGMHVIINYLRNDEAANEAVHAIAAAGGSASLMRFDISSSLAVEEALASWEEAHPDEYIDVLVNNGGIRKDNLMIFMQDEEWQSVIDTSLTPLFYITRRLLKGMVSHRHGRIINMASLSGVKGLPGQTNYSAAKGAMIAATKALAQEVGQRHITVNAICPGFIATDMTKDLNEKELSKNIPCGRFGKPEEVAALASFLAGEDSSYITGQAIQINGGLYT